jgi:hypothetical protein
MRSFERPDTPAQTYAAVAGIFLVALGALALVFTDLEFGTVDPAVGQEEFLIWSVSGWGAVFWIVAGAAGLMTVPRLAAARMYALGAGLVFSVAAVWGFADGNDIAGVLAAETANNITYAALGFLGLLNGLLPRDAQRAPEEAERERRFERELRSRDSVGRR